MEHKQPLRLILIQSSVRLLMSCMFAQLYVRGMNSKENFQLFCPRGAYEHPSVAPLFNCAIYSYITDSFLDRA